jgi:hypothetical protein
MERAFDFQPPRSTAHVSPPAGVRLEAAGMGAVQPRGVGQTPSGTFQIVQPVRRNWAVAYVGGESSPRYHISGTGFSYKQVLQSFVNSGQKALYFTYQAPEGKKYLFSCVYVNGTPCVRIATNKLQAQRGVGRRPEGLGQYTGGQITYLQNQAAGGGCGSWAEISPTDQVGWLAANPGVQQDLANIITSLTGAWNHPAEAGANIASDGLLYFDYSNTNTGATTGFEQIFMRFHIASGQPILGVCTAPGSSASGTPVVQGGGQTVVQNPGVTSTNGGSLSWSNYAWLYYSAGQTDIPTVVPPGQPAGATGAWVETRSGQFDWYPGPTVLSQVVDPSGNVWWVYSSYHAANGSTGASDAFQPPDPGTANYAVPPPALAGTAGNWYQAHPYYYVWLSSAVATGLTSGELLLLLLLGAGAVGGVAYALS